MHSISSSVVKLTSIAFVLACMSPLIAMAAVTEEFTTTVPEVVKITSSVWVDVNGDGFPDLIGATDDDADINADGVFGQLHCFDVENNTPLWTYTPSPASVINSSPAVGDITGNGYPEIVIGIGHGIGGNHQPGRIYVLDRNGAVIWYFNTLDFDGNGTRDGVYSTAAIGDLNRDGIDDFVIASFDQRVYAFRYENRLATFVMMWSFHTGDTIYSSPALANIDDDPYLEVIIGIPVHWEVSTTNTDFLFDIRYDGGMLLVLDHDGTMHPDFLNQPKNPEKPKTYTTQEIRSSPAVADIDGDGRFEIVHATSPYRDGYNGRCGPTSITPIPLPLIYAWNHNGSPAWTIWPSLGPAPSHACDSSIMYDSETSPAIGDINGDGTLEIVVGQRSTNGTGKVFVLNGTDGTFRSPYPMLLTNHLGNTPMVGIRSNPVIANLDDDPYPEIFIGILEDLMILDKDGFFIDYQNCLNMGKNSDCINAEGQIVTSTAAIIDYDCDNRLEISLGNKDGAEPRGRYSVWKSSVVTMSSCDQMPGPWPLMKNNARRTGLLDTIPPATIDDLDITWVSPSSALLEWTSTGHNGMIGCAFQYDIRFSVDQAFSWATAAQLGKKIIPSPAVSGTWQSILIEGLESDKTYRFAMKVNDEVPNISALSNITVLLPNGPTPTPTPTPTSTPTSTPTPTPSSPPEVNDLEMIKSDEDEDGMVDDIRVYWSILPDISHYDILFGFHPQEVSQLLLEDVLPPTSLIDALLDPTPCYYKVISR